MALSGLECEGGYCYEPRRHCALVNPHGPSLVSHDSPSSQRQLLCPFSLGGLKAEREHATQCQNPVAPGPSGSSDKLRKARSYSLGTAGSWSSGAFALVFVG